MLSSSEIIELSTLGSLSIISSLAVLLTYGCMQRLRKFPSNLVFWLALCCLILSLATFASIFGEDYINQNHTLCSIQAFMVNFGALGTVTWNMIIALNVVILLGKTNADTSRLSTYYHTFVWLFVGTTCITLLAKGEYGPTEKWCWINGNENALRLTFYIPLAAFILMAFACLCYVVMKVRSLPGVNNQVKYRIICRTSSFVIAFVLFWSWPLVDRLMLERGATIAFLAQIHWISVWSFPTAVALIWMSSATVQGVIEESCASGDLMARCCQSTCACCPCVSSEDAPPNNIFGWHGESRAAINLHNPRSSSISNSREDYQFLPQNPPSTPRSAKY